MKTKEWIAVVGSLCFIAFMLSGLTTALCAIWDAGEWAVKTGFTGLVLSFFGLVTCMILDPK